MILALGRSLGAAFGPTSSFWKTKEHDNDAKLWSLKGPWVASWGQIKQKKPWKFMALDVTLNSTSKCKAMII